MKMYIDDLPVYMVIITFVWVVTLIIEVLSWNKLPVKQNKGDKAWNTRKNYIYSSLVRLLFWVNNAFILSLVGFFVYEQEIGTATVFGIGLLVHIAAYLFVKKYIGMGNDYWGKSKHLG